MFVIYLDFFEFRTINEVSLDNILSCKVYISRPSHYFTPKNTIFRQKQPFTHGGIFFNLDNILP